VALAVAAVLGGQVLVGGMAAIVAGSCLGFLLYNWYPARIFMGDAGSLFVGFLLAALALKLRFPVGHLAGAAAVGLLAGLALFDTALVVISRVWHRRPIYLGGTDHTSHRLMRLGMSTPAVGVLLMVVTGLCGAIGVAVGRGVGVAVLEAVQRTRTLVNRPTNPNLGIILLLAPLVAVPAEASLQDGIRQVLAQLTIEDARGVSRSLSDFQGVWVILEFWGAHCEPCRAAMPALQFDLVLGCTQLAGGAWQELGLLLLSHVTTAGSTRRPVASGVQGTVTVPMLSVVRPADPMSPHALPSRSANGAGEVGRP
jgi:hypothetical protein